MKDKPDFEYQVKSYTILTDEYNWVLVWHPKGPKYSKDGVLQGRRSYYGRLQHLTAELFDRRARHTAGIKDLNEKLPGLVAEMKAINRLEVE